MIGGTGQPRSICQMGAEAECFPVDSTTYHDLLKDLVRLILFQKIDVAAGCYLNANTVFP